MTDEKDNRDSNFPKLEDLPEWAKQWCLLHNGRPSIDGHFLERPLFTKINIYQYELLIECSNNKDIEPWNQYRKNNPNIKIWLCHASLQNTYLTRINLKNANLSHANIKQADFSYANLQNANLDLANLQEANLFEANFKKASLINTNFQKAHLWLANLQKIDCHRANFQKADLFYSNLKGATIHSSDIEKTGFFNGKLNSQTNFTGSNLDSALIDPKIKGQLEYNIRRLGWHNWYKNDEGAHWLGNKQWLWKFLKGFTRWFWSVSDYGISSFRIIGWFASFSFIFACIYSMFPSMLEGKSGGFIHSLYFSVVTMTTLGFGDIYAAPNSSIGQLVLMGQVILGYILLGALITRLGVVFTGLGPVPKPPFAQDESRLSKMAGWMWLIFIPVGITTVCIRYWPYKPHRMEIKRFVIWLKQTFWTQTKPLAIEEFIRKKFKKVAGWVKR